MRHFAPSLIALLLATGLACGNSGGNPGVTDAGGTAGGNGGTCPVKAAPAASNGMGSPCPNGYSDCSTELCVAVDTSSPPYCTVRCPNGSCPSGYNCDTQTFAMASLTFCRQGPPPSQPSGSSEIPCKSDLDCSCQQHGLVCGSYQGTKGCTILCTADGDCQPTLGGVKTMFATCQADSANGGRKECLPNPACFSNPGSCVAGGPTGPTGSTGGTDAGGCGSNGASCFANSDCCSSTCGSGTCCAGQNQVCATATDCCAGACTGGVCCDGPGQTSNTASLCCAGLSYQSATAQCCMPKGGVCHTDGECCGGTGCISGACG